MLEKEEKLSEKPAMLWVRKGKGQFIFYSFNPLFRASAMGNLQAGIQCPSVITG
jgi:hypothetical protein